MKIAMFGHKSLPSRAGGVEIVVEELSTRMAALGHDVVCYDRGTADTSGDMVYRGVKRKIVPTWDRKGWAAVTSSFFAAVCTAFSDARTVHIHAEGPAFMCWLPKLFGKHIVVTVHGLDWQRAKWQHGLGAAYIRQGEKMAVRYADEIIVLSRNVQKYFLTTYGRKTVWIPNGVNVPQSRQADRIMSEFGLKKDSYILYLGRLVPEKRVHDLICAFRCVQTDKQLVIAGGSSDTDDYCSELKALAQGDDRILFTGFVQGPLLSELYSNAYVYVLPSETEGMPLSLLEAMSFGNCCLVSDIPECREIVSTDAVIFPACNVQLLGNALQMLCDTPDLVARYRHNAKNRLMEMHDWDWITEKTLELYR